MLDCHLTRRPDFVGIVPALAVLFAPYPDLQLQIDALVAEGNTVLRVSHTGERGKVTLCSSDILDLDWRAGAWMHVNCCCR
jgi:hypothetical protein